MSGAASIAIVPAASSIGCHVAASSIGRGAGVGSSDDAASMISIARSTMLARSSGARPYRFSVGPWSLDFSTRSAMAHHAARPPRVSGGGPSTFHSSLVGSKAALATRSGRVASRAFSMSCTAAVSRVRSSAVCRLATVQSCTACRSSETRLLACSTLRPERSQSPFGGAELRIGGRDGALVASAPMPFAMRHRARRWRSASSRSASRRLSCSSWSSACALASAWRRSGGMRSRMSRSSAR